MKKELKGALVPDLKDKDIKGVVALVGDTFERNGLHTALEMQFIELAINDSPQLVRAAKANPASLYNSILQAAECGLSLNPQWKEGYFVPYNMKVDGKDVPTVTFSPMYRGKKKLLISKGIVKNIKTKLVYEGEYFEEVIEAGNHIVKHKPNSFRRSDHTKIIGGYAAITLNNDEIQYLVKGRDYFERCKAASAAKMGGKTSPAWRLWYDAMCEKCLINAADSVIPKIDVKKETVELLNDINTNDVDYVDVTDENSDVKLPPKENVLSAPEFKELINDLMNYTISLNDARKKYTGYDFSKEQIEEIKAAGTITAERLDEIILLVTEDDSFNIKQFETILTEEQFEEVKQVIIDKAQQDG